MKLNFLNVLKGKSTPDEIAEQIVALEEKQKICEKEKQDAKERSKEIRSRIMCGEKINPNAVKEADSVLEECNINLDVVSESLEKLKEKLEEAFITLKDEASQKVIEIRRRLNRERDKAKLDLWKAKGKLFGLAFALHGHPETTRRDLESFPAFSPSVGTESTMYFMPRKTELLMDLTDLLLLMLRKKLEAKATGYQLLILRKKFVGSCGSNVRRLWKKRKRLLNKNSAEKLNVVFLLIPHRKGFIR